LEMRVFVYFNTHRNTFNKRTIWELIDMNSSSISSSVV